MDATTVTVHPFGSERACPIDLTASYHYFQNIPDLRDRRGVRYPLALLLTIALWAKLAGACQLRAIAEWARERQGELADRFGLPRPCMPHPTTWSRVFGSAVAVDALEQQLALRLEPPPLAEAPSARCELARRCLAGADGPSAVGTGGTEQRRVRYSRSGWLAQPCRLPALNNRRHRPSALSLLTLHQPWLAHRVEETRRPCYDALQVAWRAVRSP